MNIPLNIMAITIAAICIGTWMATSLHYDYRMMRKLETHRRYEQAIEPADTTIDWG